ncbi:hypothetical protein ACWGNE_00460 [Streptomyces xiamenensis]|uniref:hypothetical protein n=1 Tax=Streptomyces xiamenensis TaxID=408015 RepID=UPI0036BD0FD5
MTAWAKARSADYWSDLSVAPGWKLGGWPAHFTFRDPAEADELHCGECRGPVEALLTIDSSEWDGGTGSWRPTEDARRSGAPRYRTACEPTMVNIGRGYTLQLYNCISSPTHLPRTIMQ